MSFSIFRTTKNLNNNNYDEMSMGDRTNIFIQSFYENSNNCLGFGFNP